ncbi:MAG TPA: GNAT family N-acetyltransferase [Phycisphaerales bacterium]|nr:GNAT family N-acetyltransferase [Phycisphaerales bacterium]
MAIRRCEFNTAAELAAVHALQREAYEVEAALIGTRNIPALRESVEDLRSAEAESFWGWFDADGACAGVIATESEMDAGERLVRISRLAVGPRWFRRGIGRMLVAHVLKECPALTVKVTTGAANAPARRLYEAAGFALIGGCAAPDGTPIVEYRRRARSPAACADQP